MAKKLSFLMSFVLLLAIAGNAFGEVIKWTDGDPCDHLWKTPGNWDLNRVPSIVTEDQVRILLAGSDGCIIDNTHIDANAAKAEILKVGFKGFPGDLRMTGGILTIAKFVMVSAETLGRFYMDGGTAEVVGNVTIGKDNGNGSMTMTGGSFTTIGVFLIGHKGGIGILDMTDGTVDVDKLHIGKEGGIGDVNMVGGTIDVAQDLSIGKTVNLPSIGILTMTGGIINIAEDLKIGLEGSTGHLQLDGGIIDANELNMGTPGAADPCGTIDIRAGTLIIDGNSIEKINGYINDPNCWITADAGAGKVVMDYDIRNPGKTTLTATSGDANLPRLTINVEPNDINTDSIVPQITEPIYYWQDQLISIGAGPSKNCPYVYRFDHWEGDVADPCSPSTTVLMDGDKTVTVVFFEDERVCGDECHPILQGDLNADCYINFKDFALYAEQWLSCTHPDCDEL